MKRKIEYEARFATKDQKIILREYAKETVVSWSNGKEKKIFKGEEGMWRADDFIKVRWPDRRVTSSSSKLLSAKEVEEYKKKMNIFF